MDYVQFITTVGTLVSTIYILKCSLDKKFESVDKKFENVDKKFEDIKAELKEIKAQSISHGNQLCALTGEMKTIQNMLHALVGKGELPKTGTDGK